MARVAQRPRTFPRAKKHSYRRTRSQATIRSKRVRISHKLDSFAQPYDPGLLVFYIIKTTDMYYTSTKREQVDCTSSFPELLKTHP